MSISPAQTPSPRARVVDHSKLPNIRLGGLLQRRLPERAFVEGRDGHAAVRLAGTPALARVVTDFQQPGMQGVDAACQIRALHPRVPIMRLMAHARSAAQARAGAEARAASVQRMVEPIKPDLADLIAAPVAPVHAA